MIHHGEIIHQLGDGWATAWDTTEVDSELRNRMDSVVEAQTARLWMILDERNPYGIKVVANRGPYRPEAAQAFKQASKEAERLVKEICSSPRARTGHASTTPKV